MSKIVSITQARKDIYKIAEEVCKSHEEVIVYNSKTHKNAVIISEEDWNLIKQTLDIKTIPTVINNIKGTL